MNENSRPATRAVWRLIAPLALMALIFIESGRPMPVEVPSGGDKLLHFAAYFALTGTWGWALAPWFAAGPRALISATLAALYGASDEWHQTFIPERDGSIFDWYADVCGALLGAIVIWRFGNSAPVS
ncbi:MAG: VanZ family protein [Acidobacteriota bacterium]